MSEKKSIGKVVGFGGCMIDGFPWGSEESFLAKALEQYANATGDSPPSQTIAIHFFTMGKASHFFDSRVLKKDPQTLVVQFGYVDSNIYFKGFLKKLFFRFSGQGDKKVESVKKSELTDFETPYEYTFKTALGKHCKLCICTILRVPPQFTTYKEYEEGVRTIAGKAREHHIHVHFLTPLIDCDPYHRKLAQVYHKILKRLQPEYGYSIVDCLTPLSKLPPSKILLSDGWHLSKFGHGIVAEKLTESLLKQYHVQ